MPLWFWILLWVALCALALVFIALLGWRLFRQFMRTLREFEAAADRLAGGLRTEQQHADPHRPRPALFADAAVLKEDYVQGKERRREERRQRRFARRAARGQRQSLRDLRLS